MNLDRFRKAIFSSKKGMFIYFSVTFGLITFLFARRYTVVSAIIHMVGGVLFGLIMTKIMWKRYAYFIDNIQHDKFDTTRKYTKLFKHSLLPETKSELQEYLKFLQGTRLMNTESRRVQVGTMSFIAAMIILGLVTANNTRQIVLHSVFGVGMTGVYIYIYRVKKKTESLISEVKKRLASKS